MKKPLLGTAIAFLTAIAFFSFRSVQTTQISGKIIPADGAVMVWLIRDSDSISVKPMDGMFKASVKPGPYKVIVSGKRPYKDVLFEKVEAEEGKTADLGEIRLEQ
jgi:hypothetical protein